jgi:hypothetical protein
MHHFVNGGGGAYLSIGTALDFPKLPDVADWAFYPRADRLREKMDAEMPIWKQPFRYWIPGRSVSRRYPGCSILTMLHSSRALCKCESNDPKKRMVLILNGVDGPLRWRDLQIGGAWFPTGSSLSDPVEFIVPMDRE